MGTGTTTWQAICAKPRVCSRLHASFTGLATGRHVNTLVNGAESLARRHSNDTAAQTPPSWVCLLPHLEVRHQDHRASPRSRAAFGPCHPRRLVVTPHVRPLRKDANCRIRHLPTRAPPFPFCVDTQQFNLKASRPWNPLPYCVQSSVVPDQSSRGTLRHGSTVPECSFSCTPGRCSQYIHLTLGLLASCTR